MHAARVIRHLATVIHAVASHHGRDAQPVVGKEGLAPRLLKPAVTFKVAPRLDGAFVPPVRQRKQLAGLRQAFEALDRDKTVNARQQRVHVAHLLESLMGVAYRTGAVRVRSSPREPALRMARVCYDHLAGEMAVLLFETLQKRRVLAGAGADLTLTEKGHAFFRDFGIDVANLMDNRRPLCRVCLDWSMRRNHLAGALGAALLDRCFALGWARRAKGSRVVNFSPAGERKFREHFRQPA